jgi:hypothetical protein
VRSFTLGAVSEPEVWIESESVWRTHCHLARRLGWGALASAVLPLLLVGLTGGVWDSPLSDAIPYGFLLAPLLGVASMIARRFHGGGAGAIGVAGGDLVIVQGRKRKQIPLASLAEGWASPARGEIDLVLRGGDEIRVAVPHAEDTERLLVAAGLDASKHTMRVALGETTLLDIFTLLLGSALVLPITQAVVELAALPGGAGALIFFGLFALHFNLVRAVLGPAQVVVGADGIVVEHGFRNRFVPHDRLASVVVKHDAVDLTLTDGSRVRARARHLTVEEQAELSARVEAALAAFRRGGIAAESLSRLDRGGRALGDWRAALHAILEQHGSYRETPLTRDQLLEVLESAAAPAERRLGAALSLSAAGDADVSARIRVAAEACANPRVRIALAKVADGGIDDDAINEAIAEDEAARAIRSGIAPRASGPERR